MKRKSVDMTRRRQLLREAEEADTAEIQRLSILPDLLADIRDHQQSDPYYSWQFFRIWNHIFLCLLKEHRELDSILLSRWTLARFLSFHLSEEARSTFCDLKKNFIVVDVQDVITIPMVGEQRCRIRATTTALNDTVDIPLPQKNWEITVHGDLVQVIENMIEAKDLLVIWGGMETESCRGTKGLVLNGDFGPEATILHFQEGLQVVPRLVQHTNLTTTSAAPMLPFINDALDMNFSTSYMGQNACCLQILPKKRYTAPAHQNLPGGFFLGSQTFSNGTREIVVSNVSSNEPEARGETDGDGDDVGSENGSDISNPIIPYLGDETPDFSLHYTTDNFSLHYTTDNFSLNDTTPVRDEDEESYLNANLNQERSLGSPAHQQEQEDLFDYSKRNKRKRLRSAVSDLEEDVDWWNGVEIIPDSGGDFQPEDNHNNNNMSAFSQNRSETPSSAKIPRVVSLQEDVNSDPVSNSDSDIQCLHEVQDLVSRVLTLSLSESQTSQKSNASLSVCIQEGPTCYELSQQYASDADELRIQEYMTTQGLSLVLVLDALKKQQRLLTSQILSLSSQCLEEDDHEQPHIRPPIQNTLPVDQGLLRSREGSQASLSLSKLINPRQGSPAGENVNSYITIEQPNKNSAEIKSLSEIEVDDEFGLYCTIVQRFRSSLENENVGYFIVEDGTIPSFCPDRLDLEFLEGSEDSGRFISDLSCLIKVYNFSHILSIAEPETDVFLPSVKVERTRVGSVEFVMNGSCPGIERGAWGQKYYENAYAREVSAPRIPSVHNDSTVEAPPGPSFRPKFPQVIPDHQDYCGKRTAGIDFAKT